ncbi:MAG: thiosulfate sulfurtransferase GlpE [Leptospiraceae bacterium]|nr:thiosulfate sulfurtransferase GlpE [Leptospiraceae bacterium]MCB1314605.1 thiosulfate sulfurtransferase GlpE [Leptospiraceae bacterium]
MNVKEISPQDAKRLLETDKAVFVDIRDPGSYEANHVDGAVHLTDANVEEYLSKADREKTHIVYCYHGFSSVGGAAFLMEQGFKDVYSMVGGFAAWH